MQLPSSSLKIDIDDEILSPYLHDSRLRSVMQEDNGVLRLIFEQEDKSRFTIVTNSGSRAMFWSAGVALPVIVSGAWLSLRLPDPSWFRAKISRQEAESLIAASSMYFKNGWTLLISVNYGDTVAVIGGGDCQIHVEHQGPIT